MKIATILKQGCVWIEEFRQMKGRSEGIWWVVEGALSARGVDRAFSHLAEEERIVI